MTVSYVIRFDDDYRLIAERLSPDGASVIHAIEHDDCGCFENYEACQRDMMACRLACESDAGMGLPWHPGGEHSLHLFMWAGPIDISSTTHGRP